MVELLLLLTSLSRFFFSLFLLSRTGIRFLFCGGVISVRYEERSRRITTFDADDDDDDDDKSSKKKAKKDSGDGGGPYVPFKQLKKSVGVVVEDARRPTPEEVRIFI